MSWATWLLFTGVPTLCVVLRVRCPGPLGSCSPVFLLRRLLCLCGVFGHLAPVHWCAGSVCRVACAVSWATWILFTGVRAPPVALLVWCPGPGGSCSPVCPLGVLCCLCGVLGHLAPVHRCSRSVCCVACVVSWTSGVLFTGVPARCVALWVLCPGPLGSCSPVCPPNVLCWVCGVLGHLAPVRQCAHSVCCPVGCMCGAACAESCCGAHTQSIQTAAVCIRQGLCTFLARTRPSGRRLFIAGRGWVPSGRALIHPDSGCFVASRGWVRCRARTRPSRGRLFVAGRGWVPSGCALVHLDGGWYSLARVLVPWFVACCARSLGLRHPAAVVAWHLSVCLGCGRRRASLVCLVAPRGAPRLVRSGCSRCSSRLFRRRCAFLRLDGLRPRLYWVAARGTRRQAKKRAHGACSWPQPRWGRWARSASYPFGAPRSGCPWRVPEASVSGCVLCGGWRVRIRSLTRLVFRTVRRSTGDSACAPGLFRVDADTSPCGSEDATPGSRACVRVLVYPGQVGRDGLPGAFWCASPFPLAASSFCFARPPPGWGCPFPVPFFDAFFFCVVPFVRLCCLLLSLVSSPGCLGTWRFVFLSTPPPRLVFFSSWFFFSSRPLCAPVVCGFLWFPAPGALGLGAVCCLFC